MSDTLKVEFEIKIDEVWVDPEGNAWYVKSVSDPVVFERTLSASAPAKEVVRKWHKPGQPK